MKMKKMLDIAGKFGISKTEVLKTMHSGMTLRELEKNGFPLADQLMNMHYAILMILKARDLKHGPAGKSQKDHPVCREYLDEMAEWELCMTYAELDDYLESSALLRQKLPVNKINRTWHQILLNLLK